MASALFAEIAVERRLECSVVSAGLAAPVGAPAEQNAVTAAAELGAALTAHRAQQVTAELLAEADYVVCMGTSHARQLLSLVPQEKIRVLRCGIADPYGGSLEVYRSCAAQIAEGLPGLLPDFLCRASIVPTEESHLSALAQLEQLVFSSPASEARLRERLSLPHSHMLTALLDGRPAGFIGADEIAGEAFIDDVAVFPQHQRRGIASRLLARAELGALLRGCDKIHLECRAGNAPALALYRARGYQQVGLRKGFYTKPQEDAILMTAYFL